MVSAVSYFFIVGIIALAIAGKFCWPELLGTVPYLTYGRLRPLHVNGMLFGWLLAADIGLAYYIVPRLCGVKLWSEKLGVATAMIWNVVVLGAVIALPMGYNHGFEYAELPMPLAILVVIAWVMFGLNIFMTIATRSTRRCTSSSGTSWAPSCGRPSSTSPATSRSTSLPASTRPTSTGCTCTTRWV
jgi:cytochrome c oxidase cbb3-type subunit I